VQFAGEGRGGGRRRTQAEAAPELASRSPGRDDETYVDGDGSIRGVTMERTGCNDEMWDEADEEDGMKTTRKVMRMTTRRTR
jgi:hypothetical protein